MGAYASHILAVANLVAYWRLNETSGTNAEDFLGTNDGTYTGGYTLNQTGPLAGDTDLAVLFNGTTGYVTVPHAAALAITGDLTLEAWVNPTDRADYYWIAGKTKSPGWPSSYEWRLETSSGRPRFLIGDGVSEGGNNTGTTAPATGVWSHVAVTISGTTIAHYLNGAGNGGSTDSKARTDGGDVFLIGKRIANTSFWKGLLDEVAVYNRALTADEVAYHYRLGVAALSRRPLLGVGR